MQLATFTVVTCLMLNSVLAWRIYVLTHCTTQRYLARAVEQTAQLLFFVLLLFVVGTEPLLTRALIRSFLVSVVCLNSTILIWFICRTLAEYWYLKQGRIPRILKQIAMINEDDV